MTTTQTNSNPHQGLIQDYDLDDSLGVGGLVPAEYLERRGGGWMFNRNRYTLSDSYADELVEINAVPDRSPRPKMSENCVFRSQLVVSALTGFSAHSDLIIATCGHIVFFNNIMPKTVISAHREYGGTRDLSKYKFVFGLTQKYVSEDPPPQLIPMGNVWDIERILFGQNGTFDTTFTEPGSRLKWFGRPDWALIRLKPLERLMFPEPLPLFSGDIKDLAQRPTKLEAIGHAWATSLKLCGSGINGPTVLRTGVRAGQVWEDEPTPRTSAWEKDGTPPVDKNKIAPLGYGPFYDAEATTALRPYDFAYTFKHNLLTVPGNSGGPLILCGSNSTDKAVLGIASSGTSSGEPLLLDRFRYDQTSHLIEPYVPKDQISWNQNATKNDVWTSLITPGAELVVIIKAFDGRLEPADQHAGHLNISLAFQGLDDRKSRVIARPALDKTFDGQEEYRVWVLPLPKDYLTCELVSITIKYIPPVRYPLAPSISASSSSAPGVDSASHTATASPSVVTATYSGPGMSDVPPLSDKKTWVPANPTELRPATPEAPPTRAAPLPAPPGGPPTRAAPLPAPPGGPPTRAAPLPAPPGGPPTRAAPRPGAPALIADPSKAPVSATAGTVLSATQDHETEVPRVQSSHNAPAPSLPLVPIAKPDIKTAMSQPASTNMPHSVLAATQTIPTANQDPQMKVPRIESAHNAPMSLVPSAPENARDEQPTSKPPNAPTPGPLFVIDTLHVLSRKPGIRDLLKCTPLLRMTERTPQPLSQTFPIGPFIPQAWTDALRQSDLPGLVVDSSGALLSAPQ